MYSFETIYCNSARWCRRAAHFFILPAMTRKGTTFVCDVCVDTWRGTYYDHRIRPLHEFYLVDEYFGQLLINKAEFELSR